MTGVFATKSVNDAVPNEGLLYGEFNLFIAQIGAILISIALTVAVTVILMLILRKCGGVRVTDMDEAQGLDQTSHGERAYPEFNGLD